MYCFRFLSHCKVNIFKYLGKDYLQKFSLKAVVNLGICKNKHN